MVYSERSIRRSGEAVWGDWTEFSASPRSISTCPSAIKGSFVQPALSTFRPAFTPDCRRQG